MTTDEVIGRIMELAQQQHGLVRLDQFPKVDHVRVRHLARRGILERAAKGVFRVSGSPFTWMQGLQAGVWALGKMAVVSHSSAGRLYGFDRFEDAELEFTVGRSQRGRHLPPALGATVHTAIAHPRGDLRRVHGLPVTSPERTIVDLARDGAQQALLEAAIDSSIRLRLTSLDHIIDRLEKSKGSSRWGVAQLDSLVLTSGGHSVLERAFLRLLRRSGMPMPRPQVVHRINGRHVGRVDFLFEEQAVVVEVSGGRGHSTASERARDAKRRNGLQQMGRTVLEFTYEDVLTRESYVRDTLKAAGVSRN